MLQCALQASEQVDYAYKGSVVFRGANLVGMFNCHFDASSSTYLRKMNDRMKYFLGEEMYVFITPSMWSIFVTTIDGRDTRFLQNTISLTKNLKTQ